MSIFPSFDQFKNLSQGRKRAAVYKALPVCESLFDIFLKLGRKKQCVLLESLKGSSKITRYSIIGIDPFLVFRSKENFIEIIEKEKSISFYGDPLKELRKIMMDNKASSYNGIPDFCGGAIGYFSYDFVHWFEQLPKTTRNDVDVFDAYFMFFDTAIVFNHLENKIFIIHSVKIKNDLGEAYESAVDKILEIEANLKNKSSHQPDLFCKSGKVESNFSQHEFEDIVRRAKEYIFAGDIFQVNLSLRLNTYFEGEGLSLYKILREINPSPFAGYLNFGDVEIISSSPERLICLDGNGVIETRPIAGTRRRGIDFNEDEELSSELILNPKERAEHIMLVDLERNDIGRISNFGTVKVDELMVTENYSHVIHIVSNIRGEIVKGKDCFDVLKACFPGGTITGCPKLRSMEIIDELENVRRGIYTGSIGYISFSGHMDLNIAIRTFVLKDKVVYVQAGAGIVADSDPAKEYFESLQKAKALIETLEAASKLSVRELT
ncbi:MAG: anthranilate synthase component I family protein [Actinobacteria bacterium]|nr:anthranilate synthase component I family protein [Actinomycetota bacterium]